MFNSDLKRFYYGATAFLVFLVAFFSLQILTDRVLRLMVVSSVPWEERRSPMPTPLLAPTPVIETYQATPVSEPTLTPAQRAQIEKKERASSEDWELRSAKESIASSLAIVLVALPVWFWHWRRWRALTQTQSAQLFRLYVYALMLVALVIAVFRGADAIGKVLIWLLGIADLSTRFATLTFAQEFISSVLFTLIALLAWWYHWINVRGEKG